VVPQPKRVLGIIAGIPVARHRKANENRFDSLQAARPGDGRGGGERAKKIIRKIGGVSGT